jgi:hypothetical protein
MGGSSGSADSRARTSGPKRPHARANLITILLGGVVLIVCGLAAARELTDLEVAVFRGANDLPQSLHPVIWPLMQYGTFVTIPLVALVALVALAFREETSPS